MHKDAAAFARQVDAVVHHPRANPLAVVAAMDRGTTQEWRDWDPDAISDYCRFKDDDVDLRDKVMACQVAVTNPDVFEAWPLFAAVNDAFNHRRSQFEWSEPPLIPELAWTCSCLRKLQSEQFHPGVLRFIASACVHEGLLLFPWVGGEGLCLLDEPASKWLQGVIDVEGHRDTIKAVKDAWDEGALQNLEVSDVDDANPHHVQLQILVQGEAHIRDQESAAPSEYEGNTG